MACAIRHVADGSTVKMSQITRIDLGYIIDGAMMTDHDIHVLSRYCETHSSSDSIPKEYPFRDRRNAVIRGVSWDMPCDACLLG